MESQAAGIIRVTEESTGRNGDVQKVREKWRCEIVERVESKKQNLKINAAAEGNE